MHSYRSLSGREAAYTIHGYEVNIHASEASSGIDQLPSGSSKVRREGGRERKQAISDLWTLMIEPCIVLPSRKLTSTLHHCTSLFFSRSKYQPSLTSTGIFPITMATSLPATTTTLSTCWRSRVATCSGWSTRNQTITFFSKVSLVPYWCVLCPCWLQPIGVRGSGRESPNMGLGQS